MTSPCGALAYALIHVTEHDIYLVVCTMLRYTSASLVTLWFFFSYFCLWSELWSVEDVTVPKGNSLSSYCSWPYMLWSFYFMNKEKVKFYAVTG